MIIIAPFIFKIEIILSIMFSKSGTKCTQISKSSDRFMNLQLDSAFTSIKGYEISSFLDDQVGNNI